VISLASVPAAHPYVRAVVDPQHVRLLPDPVPPTATLPGQWWPPRLFEPEYLAAHLADIDVLHVHFGFDATPPSVLAHVVTLLAQRQIPLVLTVHDLHNPHFCEVGEHLERLGVLVAAAAEVITLTEGAATEVQRRWGRSAVVMPHPPALAPEHIGVPRPSRPQQVVAVHGKSLRANIDPWPVLDALVPQAGDRWRLRLDLDREVLRSPRSAEATRDRLDTYAAAGVDVRVHPRFTDDALRHYLAEIDVMVLPYRFGTHSGWVEACYDAGVCAVVPDNGYYHEQQHFPVYSYNRDGLDTASLQRAVAAALAAEVAAGPALRAERLEVAARVRSQMTELYSRVCATATVV
jgi:hypothetical protein